MSFITSIGIANPANKVNQKQIAEFMIGAMQLQNAEADKLRALYRASGIEYRHSVIEDYGSTPSKNFYSSSKDLEPFPDTQLRMKLFRKEAVELSVSAAQNCLQFSSAKPTDITHLVVVSCTGMFAPGLDIDLIRRLKLDSTTKRTSINFMGCYAAFNALRVADSFCKSDPNAKVLIVCTELCSIHFQKENSEDNKLANALFADGSASVLVEGNSNNSISLKIENFFCDIAIESENEMAWTIGNNGFEMKLSSYVPEVIKNGIHQLTQSLLTENNIKLDDVTYFAIHPGGKKILETIEQELQLTKDQNKFSYEVLREYGNMSSPTVLFVLHKIFSELRQDDHNKKILSFGFGPGLTLESLILTVNSK
ncbi:MAG: type III polyketide synthase [Cyclobacteriaceae bacterium]